MDYSKFIFYLIFVAFSNFSVFAQSWESVKNDTAYLYGEGFGTTKAEADQFALNDLISKISLQVSSSTTTEMQESVVNGNLESKESFGMLMNTYSQATLTNTESFVLVNDPDAEEAHVVRFIKKSEIKRIFENRRLKIESMMETAIRAESKGKIDVALKHLYWGLILTKSLQYPNEAYFVDEDGNKHLLMTWIPAQLNNIFSELDVKTIKKNKGEVELSFLYKGIPVNSIDYTYFDGSDWSSLYSAKDGVGVLDMPPSDVREFYQIKFEYEYRGEAHIDDELESVMGLVKGFRLPASRVNVKALPEKRTPSNVASVNSAQGSTNGFNMTQSFNTLGGLVDVFKNNSFSSVPTEIYKMPSEIEDSATYKKILTKIVAAIKVGAKESVASYFTSEGLDIYERLLLYGQAKIVGQTDFEFYRLGTDVIARGLQMSFSFKTGSRKAFVQDVVFTFNSENKINNIAFGLGKTANDDILGKSVWPEAVRMAIVQFLENYQTAYALKRLDYIEGVFDDDAVIITGSYVPRKAKIADGGGYNIKREVKYTRYDKQAYLKYLSRSFESKEFINIRFANTDIRKTSKGEEYAIQLYQEYYSSNYGDKGYLFLMVNMNNPDAPVIIVRTWQPEKDPKFGIYGPEMFD